MAEDYYNCKKGTAEEGLIPALLLLFDTGYGTCVAGWGPIYDNYISSKQLGEYTGRNVRPRFPDEDDYAKSRLRIIPFDYAFRFIKKDITKRKYLPFDTWVSFKVGNSNSTTKNIFVLYCVICYFQWHLFRFQTLKVHT